MASLHNCASLSACKHSNKAVQGNIFYSHVQHIGVFASARVFPFIILTWHASTPCNDNEREEKCFLKLAKKKFRNDEADIVIQLFASNSPPLNIRRTKSSQ